MPERRTVVAPKLRKGDGLRVVAPSRSLAIISPQNVAAAERRLNQIGFDVSYGRHVYEIDALSSSSPAHRITDLEDAFRDPSVAGIVSAIGGYNSNQIIEHLDYDVVRSNPKIVCGFSDMSTLLTAFHAQTGLITYLGPHFSTFAMKKGNDYTETHFQQCCMSDGDFEVTNSKEWSDDEWYLDQERRTFIANDGWIVLSEGEAEGRLIGGNILSLVTLSGTRFWPGLDRAILFIETPGWINPSQFDQLFQALLLQPDMAGVRGMVFGRFQKSSGMTLEIVQQLLRIRLWLRKLPIIANADFGHTSPIFTLPIGGRGRLIAHAARSRLRFELH